MARYAPKGALLPELVVTPGCVSLMGIRASLQNRGFRFAAAYGRLVWAAVMVAGTFRQHFVVDSIPDVPPLDYCPRSAGEAHARTVRHPGIPLRDDHTGFLSGQKCGRFYAELLPKRLSFRGSGDAFFGRNQRKRP